MNSPVWWILLALGVMGVPLYFLERKAEKDHDRIMREEGPEPPLTGPDDDGEPGP